MYTDTQTHTHRHRRGSNERAYTTCKCIHLVIVRYSKCLCKCKRVCNALHSVTNEALFHLRAGSRQTVALHEGFSRARAQYIVCQMETTTLYAYLLSVRHCHCNVSCVRSLHWKISKCWWAGNQAKRLWVPCVREWMLVSARAHSHK